MLLVQDKHMTDEEIRASADSEWLGLLREMWEAIGKPVDEKRLLVYARQLGIVPFGLLEKSVARAIRTNGQYQTVPTVGAIWDAVRKELDTAPALDIANAIANWVEASFESCIVRFQ